MSFAIFRMTIVLLLNFNNENARDCCLKSESQNTLLQSEQQTQLFNRYVKSQSFCFALLCFAYGYLAFQKVADFRLIYDIMFHF